MKKIAAVVFLFLASCQSYSTTQIGPDRYAVKSTGHDHGPSDYTKVLETAYSTCKQAQYRDYIVLYGAQQHRDAVLHFKCTNEERESNENNNQASKEGTNVGDIWRDMKQKVNEFVKQKE